MKNVFKLLLIFSFVLVFSPKQSQATHVVGADLTYFWVGGNTYQLKLYFYRDCGGVGAPSSITLNANAPSCGFNQNYSLSQVAAFEVPPQCNLGLSTCSGGSVYGIQEYVYKGTVTLPGNCADWKFSYYVCCRNNAITNITSPGSAGQYFYAYLDNLNVPGNSSPNFVNGPAPFQCINSPFCFDMGAFDPDGDSLVYQMVNPMRNATNSVNWSTGYSTVYPINSSPLMNLNSLTGNVCIWPLSLGIYSMAIRVYEYRNGVLIGSIIRDIQQNLSFCPCMVLPVSLIDFSSLFNKFDNSIEVKWSTASEQNNSHFILERSTDSRNFDFITNIEAAGNSSVQNDYKYTDHNAGDAPVIYYRLKEADKDGHEAILKTIAQRNDRNIPFVKLLQNPIENEINLIFSNSSKGSYTVTLLTSQGEKASEFTYTKQEGVRHFSVPLNDANSGMYFVRVSSNEEQQTFKVVKF